MEEKNSKFSFHMKIILTSLMIGIMIILSILFGMTANAYNLPSYEPNDDSSIEDDFKAFGMSIYDYQSNYDSSDDWQVVYFAENYTERPGYIINYIYLYNRNLDNTICCFDLKMQYNDIDYFNACIDNYTRGPDEITGDTWQNHDMLMTWSQSLFIGPNKDTYHNIIKLRLDANVMNLDESRTYKINSISWLSYTNDKHSNTEEKTTNSNYSKTYNSVYTDDDRKDNSNIDLPLYQEAWNGIGDYENEIFFSYVNCGFNTKLSQIKLNNQTVPLEFVDYYNDENKAIFKTNAFCLKANGTMTYKINGYYVGSKFYDTSKEDVKFRYISDLTSVTVEADKTVSHYWAPIGGNYSVVDFHLKEKESGKKIENAKTVHCRYTYKGVTYAPTLNVKDASLGSSFEAAFSVMFNGSNKNGILKKSADDSGNLYKWGFGIKIEPESFDILTITYEVENQIITGSCYKNGLHIETIDGVDHIYDMDGVNRDKDYTTKDDGLIYEKNEDGSAGNEEGTTNPPTEYKESTLDKVLNTLNITLSVIIGGCILYIVVKVFTLLTALFKSGDNHD